MPAARLSSTAAGGVFTHEGERPVLVDRDHHGQDEALLAAGLRVEALAELHDVDAVLAEGRTHRGRGIGLAAVICSLTIAWTFLPSRIATFSPSLIGPT